MKTKNKSEILNALKAANETMAEAIENLYAESTISEVPVPLSVLETETATNLSVVTKAEQSITATTSAVQQSTLQEKQSLEQEAVKGLNIPIPISIYKRLSNMKIDADNESLKSLGLKAIIEYLDKNGY